MADLLDLPATLERWGLTVVPVTGWQDRRRPGTFRPIGVLIHHTAAPGPKDNPSLQVCIDGRRDLPGPLCHILVARSGKVYVISIGKANHAGTGGPIGPVGVDDGNVKLVGIEAENDGVGEPWPAVQVGAMVKATAAVLDLLGQPRTNVWGHREYTPRKIDPAGITMAQFRESVAAARPPGATTMPTPTTLPEDDPGARIQRAINANGLQPPLKVDGDCGPATADGLDKVLAYLNAQVAKFQAANTASASERDQAQARAIDLAKANATSADTITRLAGERDTARSNREAAEAEVAMLRKQIQAGGNRAAVLDIVADLATLGDKVHEVGAKLQGLA